MFTESLLAAALTLSPWYGDNETAEERYARLHTIAQAIDAATLHAVCADGAPEVPGLDRAERSEEEGGDGAEKEGSKSDDEVVRERNDRSCSPVWYGSPKDLAFLLLTQAYFETRLAAHIHAGACRVKLGECDGGKAASLWQLHHGRQLSKERWKKLSGTSFPPTARAAYEAARALGRGRNHCRSMAGAISLYATGKTCSWAPAQQRLKFSARLSEKYSN